MIMWRDEFLARERIAERERTTREAARVRNLLSDKRITAALGPDGAGLRRALARVAASVARASMRVAQRLDTGVDLDLERGPRTARS